jgi:hypothetical protein
MDKRIFIGSSTEALPVAKEVQSILGQKDHIVDLWTSVFAAGNIILDALLEKCSRYDFAIFIFQPDDITLIRKEKKRTVRDNVIFEAGIFMRAIGRSRVYLLQPAQDEQPKAHILSDIGGLIIEPYFFPKDPNDLRARLEPVCHRLQKIFKQAAPSLRHNRLAAIPGKWKGTLLQDMKEAKIEEFTLEGDFEISGEKIRANFILKGNLYEGISEAKLIAQGDFVSKDFVKLDYRYTSLEQAFDFGTLVLGLQAQGREMVGKYVGYGPFSDSIIKGDIMLTKE